MKINLTLNEKEARVFFALNKSLDNLVEENDGLEIAAKTFEMYGALTLIISHLRSAHKHGDYKTEEEHDLALNLYDDVIAIINDSGLNDIL